MTIPVTLNGETRPWYKERWPWFLMAGPTIAVIAGTLTFWLAVHSNDGLVTDDYYKEGMAVNQLLDRDKLAVDMGLHADVMRSGLKLRMLLGSANAGVKLPESLVLKLAHPTRAGRDQMVHMNADGQGIYSGAMTADIAGRWIVSIEDPAGKWRLQGEWRDSDSADPLRLVAKAGM